ncbi:MAG TPA: alpha/beta hydrolase fold domain-containing protein [Pyrinomonadaceae bacterium]|nr:alpha/beta hydrolase fold domain-containing protein [Pyrinomonadaceae bacterium]
MPSWQARIINGYFRAVIRRRHWGDELSVARRARRHFGTPGALQKLRSFGVRVSAVSEGGVRGEWVEPPEPEGGAILYFHGGGYVAGSAAGNRPITAALARLARRRVFSLDYRLAPEHRYPAALDDALAAYRALLDGALGGGRLPASTIALAGDSAGGGLALALLLRARDEGLPAPGCAVCFSPWTDLSGSGESVRANDGRCVFLRPENCAEFAGAYLAGASPLDPYASPVFGDLRGLPPVLLQVGSTELLLDDARRVHEKIGEAGGLSELEVYDDVAHCWQMLDGFVPEARTALRSAARFVGQHLRP